MKAVLILIPMITVAIPAAADTWSASEGIAFADLRGRSTKAHWNSAGEFRGTGTLLEGNESRMRRVEELKEIFKDIRPAKYKFTGGEAHNQEKNQTEESSAQ